MKRFDSGVSCSCTKEFHNSKRILITGGPGAGKTAVLELAKKSFCEHTSILPEAASIVFGGGFWRRDSVPARKAAQCAIFHVQREMENLVEGEKQSALVLCDRGSLDGLAYWPGTESEFWDQFKTSREIEFQRYSLVIHLRTPSVEGFYNHRNPIRTETFLQSAEIDQKLVKAWEGHPNRIFIESSNDFLDKASLTIQYILKELPDCCKT